LVPKKIGDELRRRRITLRLKQADVAKLIGTTRAYVSAVERGVDWDPDAEKVVLWSRALGWDDDFILRRLNRMATPLDSPSQLSPEIMAALREVISAGIRDGIERVLEELRAASGAQSELPIEDPKPVSTRH
jgi:transcriptional regulator with XRE-family HTH domain